MAEEVVNLEVVNLEVVNSIGVGMVELRLLIVVDTRAVEQGP